MSRRLLVPLALLANLAAPVAAQDLYDDTQLRTLRLTFHQGNWWNLLIATYGTPNYIAADLEVDGVLYPDVGVKVRGQATYFCAKGQKVPFKVKTDAFVDGQDLYGYDTFRLNNGAGDPTFLREAVMSKLMGEYVPMAKRAFSELEMNGESWGVYIIEQQKDGDYMDDVYGDDAGHRFKAVYPNALAYLGADPNAYKGKYLLKGKGPGKPYEDLVELCDVLNNTPLGDHFVSTLQAVLDVDSVLWMMAGNNLFGNMDSYQGNSHNYYVLRHPLHERFYVQTHDLDLSFGTYGSLATTYSIKHGYNSGGRPLTFRLWKKGPVREEYYDHLRVMAEDAFDWEGVAGPLAWRYHDMIDAAVLADTKKIFSYQDFKDGITQDVDGTGSCWFLYPGLQRWVEERQAFVLAHPDIDRPRVELADVRHFPSNPAPDEPVAILARVVGPEQPSKVELRHRAAPGPFERQPMEDDGLHMDGAAGDGVFGVVLEGLPAGGWVDYVVMTIAATDGARSFTPRKAEMEPLRFQVAFGGEGVRISEYMYSGAGAEFLELTNTGAAPVDLTGWSLDDASGDAGTLDLSPLGQLDPGRSAVVTAGDAAAFAADWALPPAVAVLGGNALAPLGRNDTIHLFDAAGALVDRLRYGDEELPDSVRAKDAAAWACDAALGADDVYRWQLAELGDGQGSWASASGDLGSPGSFASGAECPSLGTDYCASNANSTGVPADLDAIGRALVEANELRLVVEDLPPGQLGYFLLSDAQANVPGIGQGVLCLGPPIVRFDRQVLAWGAEGRVTFAPDLWLLPQDTVVQAGETWSFQLWYRDVNPGATSNTSNGLAVDFE